MAEAGDPTFINILLNQENDFKCYFVVGGSSGTTPERFGVESTMLMAHSLFLRRVLNIQRSELKEKWDFKVTYIKPRIFKNLLRYVYGFNNIQTYSLSDAVELLKIANEWIMQNFEQDLAKHIRAIVSPVTVPIALQDPVCLAVEIVRDEIDNLITKHPNIVFGSTYLNQICPENMRAILKMDAHPKPNAYLWRVIIKWANHKVFNEEVITTDYSRQFRLEHYIRPTLITPCLKNMFLCSLQVIDLVEEIISENYLAEESLELLSKYHVVPNTFPKKLFVCTESDKFGSLKHQEFDVKTIPHCNTWLDAVMVSRSLLYINTANCSIQLYSLVYTGRRIKDEDPTMKEKDSSIYDCLCVVKISVVDKIDNTRTLVSEVTFKTCVRYGEDFPINITTGKDMCKLEPNKSYEIETNFSSPHPLWYTHDIDDFCPNQEKDFDVACGIVDKVQPWYGSHVKYLLFQTSFN